jgi:hypothetical protein
MTVRLRVTWTMLLALAVFSVGCHRMTQVPAPIKYIEGAKPSRIWVTRPGGDTFIVDGPQLFGDTLVGYINGEYREVEFEGSERVVVRQPARTRTAILVAAGIAGTAVFGYLISGVGTSGNPGANTDCADDPDQPECEGMGHMWAGWSR